MAAADAAVGPPTPGRPIFRHPWAQHRPLVPHPGAVGSEHGAVGHVEQAQAPLAADVYEAAVTIVDYYKDAGREPGTAAGPPAATAAGADWPSTELVDWPSTAGAGPAINMAGGLGADLELAGAVPCAGACALLHRGHHKSCPHYVHAPPAAPVQPRPPRCGGAAALAFSTGFG